MGPPAVAGKVVVGVAVPDGEPLAAPLKAGGEPETVTLGVAVLLLGLRTLFPWGANSPLANYFSI